MLYYKYIAAVYKALFIFLLILQLELSSGSFRYILEKKEALCLSCVRKPEKFSMCDKRRHSGSHAIAWAAITISVIQGFLRTFEQRCGIVVPRFGVK